MSDPNLRPTPVMADTVRVFVLSERAALIAWLRRQMLLGELTEADTDTLADWLAAAERGAHVRSSQR